MILLSGGQLRVAGTRVIGFDMGSVLAIARELGLTGPMAVELLAAGEGQMVRIMNNRVNNSGDET